MAKFEESKHPRDEDGKFTNGNGHAKTNSKDVARRDAEKRKELENKYTSDSPIEPKNVQKASSASKSTEQRSSFGGRTSAEFANDLQSAKYSVSAKDAWRVTAHTREELDSEYPGAKLHTTKGGSTVAVTTDGDIVSLCKKDGDTQRGSDLLKLAVENGGKKLDSYSGNHDFYTRNGFEPISWCEWNDDYAPVDWSAKRNEREPIIFYKYTGKPTTESAEDFMARVKASDDYDTAKKVRDKKIGGKI